MWKITRELKYLAHCSLQYQIDCIPDLRSSHTADSQRECQGTSSFVSIVSIGVIYYLGSDPDLWYLHPRAASSRAVLGYPQPATSKTWSGLHRAVQFPEQTPQRRRQRHITRPVSSCVAPGPRRTTDYATHQSARRRYEGRE